MRGLLFQTCHGRAATNILSLSKWLHEDFRSKCWSDVFSFTSYRAMRVAAEILRDQKKPIFVQGEDSKIGLIEGFKENKGSILMGTDSLRVLM